MMRHSITLAVAAGLCLTALATPLLAQARCPEGRAMNGQCVNPGLAMAARKSVLAYTQPKFSYTAPAHLPREDRDYPISRSWHELLNVFYYPPVTIPSGGTSPKP
jgi:hypothetical protein